VADPLGGSYFVEALTEEMERRAEEIFAHVDQLGNGSMLDGVIVGIEEGWFQGEIADAAYDFEKKVNRGERVVVGVNRFPDGNDDDEIALLRITNEDERRQRERLADVKRTRDEAAVQRQLDALKTTASDRDANVMPTLIDTVRAHATVGEIMATLAEVFGRYVEHPRI
jgi:methylmalonyl-CoA mutase N-terminal domain/subunit